MTELGAEALQQSCRSKSLVGIATSQLARSDKVGEAQSLFVIVAVAMVEYERRAGRKRSSISTGSPYLCVQSLAAIIGGFCRSGFPGYSNTGPGATELLGSCQRSSRRCVD